MSLILKMEFYDECQGRDQRLAQTIRTPGYQRDGKPAAPNFNGYSFTGYQPIKYTLDASRYDEGALNTNAIPLFRFAEVLLNYAEAKAEMGTLTDADWGTTSDNAKAVINEGEVSYLERPKADELLMFNKRKISKGVFENERKNINLY